MGYCLINGTRYYRDEHTGQMIVDNASREEADQREHHGWRGSRGTVRNPQASVGKSAAAWKIVVPLAILAVALAVLFHNHPRVSEAEKTISDYMTSQTSRTGAEQDTDSQDAAENSETEYLLPESASRYLDVSEIEGRSREEVQLMINEIYARHGREFHNQSNIDYFSARNWYTPVPGKTDDEIVSEFNDYEKANVDLLSRYL